MDERTRRAHPARGMTLIEMMVVVLIMALIMGAVGYAVFRALDDAKVKTTRLKVRRSLDAVQAYLALPPDEGGEEHACPETLKALVPRHVKWSLTRDAWRRPLLLECSEERICVWSTGPNRRDEQGGGDDIRMCEQRGLGRGAK